VPPIDSNATGLVTPTPTLPTLVILNFSVTTAFVLVDIEKKPFEELLFASFPASHVANVLFEALYVLGGFSRIANLN